MLYVDNVGGATREFHKAIVEAIANGGKLPEELADVFVLRKTPAGSACEWAVDWA